MPCVFACVDADDHPVGEYVVKFRSKLSNRGSAFECIAAHLASHFQIAMPAPALVELDPRLAEAIPDSDVREAVTSSAGGANFGTRNLESGMTIWPLDRTVPPALRQTAGEILAFDVMIDNADRSREKPNLLQRGSDLFILDHEKAFAFVRVFGSNYLPFDTTEAGRIVRDHPLYRGVRREDVDLIPFVDRLSDLTDSKITAICDDANSEFPDESIPEVTSWLCRSRERAHLVPTVVQGALP